MGLSPEAFAQLLERIREGDEDALSTMVQEHEGIIRRSARRLLGPLLRPFLDSVDIAQSVHRSLLIGFRNKSIDVSTQEQLIALALTLVRRKVARHWRKIKPQQHLANQPITSVERVLYSTTNPAEQAEHNDDVQHLLENLPDELDRRLIYLRLQGYSTADVSRELDLDSRFLRVRLGRLRQKLREKGLLTEWL